MTDVILELLRAIAAGFILYFMFMGLRSDAIRNAKGSNMLLCGFALLFFGTLIDITDNFTQLNRFIFIGDTPAQAFMEKVVGYLFGFMLIAIGVKQWLPQVVQQQIKITDNLENSEKEVKILQGFLPICANCKNIRDDKGYWSEIESYIDRNSEAKFSHAICPDCINELYPELASEILPND